MPQRPRVIHPPNIRSVRLDVFHFNVIYRELSGVVQILAVAHYRRQPGYWLDRA
jgi:toxin ParE1/3/4